VYREKKVDRVQKYLTASEKGLLRSKSQANFNTNINLIKKLMKHDDSKAHKVREILEEDLYADDIWDQDCRLIMAENAINPSSRIKTLRQAADLSSKE